MVSRRSRTRAGEGEESSLRLLEISHEATRPVRIDPDSPLVIGEEGSWEVKITAAEKATVEVSASAGAAVRVNEVEVRNIARARAGDVIALPDRSFLVQHFSLPAPLLPILFSHEAFEQRFNDEVDRAAQSSASTSILLIRSRALFGEGLRWLLTTPEFRTSLERAPSIVVGRTAPGTVGFLWPGATTNEADELRERISEALGRLGRPFRWGWATTPTDAMTPATLWGRALDRLFADQTESVDDFPHADPVMVQLWSLCETWARMKGGAAFQAETGSGRETLARVLHERRTPQAPFIVFRTAKFDSSLWRLMVDRAIGGTLYLRHIRVLPASERVNFWQATAFRPMAGLQADELAISPITVSIPALRDRPLDILPIAEHILLRCSNLDAPRKLQLPPSVRLLLSKAWTGSVRELKNVLQLATLLVDASGEVLPEHLRMAPASVGSKEANVRAALRSLERRTFLDVLARTTWNVTEAARVLGLPRRTVVYRMSKLGLKRPPTE